MSISTINKQEFTNAIQSSKFALTEEKTEVSPQKASQKLDTALNVAFLGDTIGLGNTIGLSTPNRTNYIQKQTMNNDGTVSTTFKNGVSERLDKYGRGTINLPNGIQVQINETDNEGIPTNLKATLNGKEIKATVPDDIFRTSIKLEDLDKKETYAYLNSSKYERDAGLSQEEKEKMPQKSWGNMEFNYYPNSPRQDGGIRTHQKINTDGRMEISGGDLTFGSKTLIDETLKENGKLFLHDDLDWSNKPDYENVTENTGSPYEFTPTQRYYKNERQPDGSFKNVLVKEIPLPKHEKRTIPTNAYDARWNKNPKEIWENGQKYEVITDGQATVVPYITKDQIKKSL